MAWTERYICDVCGKQKMETEEWWLALVECHNAQDGAAPQPLLKLQPWNNLTAHSAGARHLCGLACAHTFLDRWMNGLLAVDGPIVCKDVL
jgi:hypothetical protein